MRRTLIIHPFLFALFPPLFLYARNIEQFTPGVLVVPVVVLLAATAVLWGLLGLILRNLRKAGLIVSLFLLLFLSPGHVYRGLPPFHFRLWGIPISSKTTTLSVEVLILLIAGLFISRTRLKLRQLTRIINVAAVAEFDYFHSEALSGLEASASHQRYFAVTRHSHLAS